MEHDIVEAIRTLGSEAYPTRIPDGLSSLGHYRHNTSAISRALPAIRRKGWVAFEKQGRRDIYSVLPAYPGRSR